MYAGRYDWSRSSTPQLRLPSRTSAEAIDARVAHCDHSRRSAQIVGGALSAFGQRPGRGENTLIRQGLQLFASLLP
jgi:hypothetical protein